MALETFRWFLSTVAQTLGAVSAIILAAYIMWVQRQRAIQEETSNKALKYIMRVSTKQIRIIKYFNCSDYLDFLNTNITEEDISKSKEAELDNVVLSDLLDFRNRFRHASEEIQKSQQLWIPLLLSFVTIIGSLLAMMFDGCIANYAPVAWDWIISGAVMLFAGTALGWYFVFLYRVISPRSKRS